MKKIFFVLTAVLSIFLISCDEGVLDDSAETTAAEESSGDDSGDTASDESSGDEDSDDESSDEESGDDEGESGEDESGETSGDSTGGDTAGDTSSDGSSDGTTDSPSITVTSTSSTAATVTISGYSAKTAYLIVTNPTANTISNSNSVKYPYISSVSNVTTTSTGSSSSSGGSSSGGGHGSGGSSGHGHHSVEYSDDTTSSMKFSYYQPESYGVENFQVVKSASRSAATNASLLTSASHESYYDTVGMTKDLYIYYTSGFTKKSATLQACGEYCNIWVLDDYYDDVNEIELSDSQYSGEKAWDVFQQKFDSVYPVETALFGCEYDSLSGSTTMTDTDGKTDHKINIVLFDLYDDDSSGSVLGYFMTSTSSDYLPSSENTYSNQGKYFYVDSYFMQDYFEETLSTLIHEFQHMLKFSNKTLTLGVSTDETWFEEMCSMLAEDALQTYAGISDEYAPRGRFNTFNGNYSLSGIEYNDSSDSTTCVSYAVCYTFGAWLVRNYGGAALIHEMASNLYDGWDCIVNAVQTVTGKTVTKNQLLQDFAVSCALQSCDYSINKASDAYSISGIDYDYVMTAANLWDSDFEWSCSSSYKSYFGNDTDGSYLSGSTTYYKMLGPAALNYGAYLSSLRPYGFVITKVGTVDSDSAELTVTIPSSSSCEWTVVCE